jgi:hypothetical protein
MDVTKPTFIVADLPDSIAAWVRSVRLKFEPAIAHLPAEITLAGSSGLGAVAPGQSIAWIQSILEPIVAGHLPFETQFLGIDTFHGTDIFFASPDPNPFETLHAAIARSGITFAPSRFPYRAHCSLKGLTRLRPGEREALMSLRPPAEPFTVRRISVYEIDQMQPNCLLSLES